VRPLLFTLYLLWPLNASAQPPADAPEGPRAEAAGGAVPSAAPPEATGAGVAGPDRSAGDALDAPRPGGHTLARPDALDAERTARLLAGIEARRAALARDRGGAELEMAVAVNLYVGGALLALLTTSLLVGVAFEGACLNGVIDECTDGADFLIGALPAAIGSFALFAGAFTTETRARHRHRLLDEREHGIEDAERALPAGVRLALSPAGLAVAF
jgi:hypothetical protein